MLAHVPLLEVALVVDDVALVAVLAVIVPLGGVSPCQLELEGLSLSFYPPPLASQGKWNISETVKMIVQTVAQPLTSLYVLFDEEKSGITNNKHS